MAKVEIFSGPQCSYCEQAKALLDAKGIAFEDRNISDEGHRAELVRRLPRSRSIPQIFVDDEHIGGLEDLRMQLADGRFGGPSS